jgi:arginine-tRNA-protein transferase
MSEHRLRYYLSDPHTCAYLPDRQAVMATIDPRITIDQLLYTQLAQLGFRRSGRHVYRPQCPSCQACIPLRVAVADFKPNRSQRRVWQRNHNIQVKDTDAVFDEQHFKLFQRYVNVQHQNGGMDNPEENDYLAFLSSPDINSRFFEFRLHGQLLAVAVTDRLNDGLSAVYTFYDPKLAKRSPGVFTLLWQIEHCRHLGLDWLYLGFWISECRKMSYKDRYRPCEILTPEGWHQLT